MRIKGNLHTQPITGGTSTKWTVKGKKPWLNLINGKTRNGACKFRRKRMSFAPIRMVHKNQSIGKAHSCFQGICQPITHIRLDHQSVYQYLYVMLGFLVEMWRFLNI